MINRGKRNGRYVLGLVVLVLLGLGTLVWLERTSLLAWFHVRMLTQAGDANREARAARVGQMGEAVLPGLLECLKRDQLSVCLNARAGLAALAHQGGRLDEVRTADLLGKLARDFAHFSTSGQRQVLEMAVEWFPEGPAGDRPVPVLMTGCSRLLEAAFGVSDSEVQAAGLQLCQALVGQPQGDEALSTGRELVRACLQSASAEVRRKAVQVAMHPRMDLLETVAGLLHDSDAEVRRAAILAVGPPPTDKGVPLVVDEVLLPSLGDPDAEVRRLTEEALRARGLGPEHLELARLLIDPQPTRRMRVLDHLRRASDLDPGIWLRRLSQDPAPSVRAAAIRVMGQQTTVDLTDRLEQMAQSDPSPTVSYLAGFYLKVARSLQSGQGTGLMWLAPGEGAQPRN
jgi:hypothetical protein